MINFGERIVAGESTKSVSVEAVQYYSNAIIGAITPIYSADIVFALAALEVTMQILAQSKPEAAELAEMLQEAIGYRSKCVTMPVDTPETFANIIKEMLR